MTPARDLESLVLRSPAGTTFWLTAGVHRLGPGIYNQVLPKDRQTFVGAPGAIIDGRRTNRYAFGGKAEDVTVANLTIRNFGQIRGNQNEGVVNHDAAAGWTIRDSTIARNAGAGIMIGSGNRVIRNCLTANGQYGFNAYRPDGVRNVVLRGNEIRLNNTDDWESVTPGCGCTGGGKFWETSGARVIGNLVHDNRGVGLWADTNNTGFLFERNVIADNDGQGLMYETSYNARIVDNRFVRNALVWGSADRSFPNGAIYLSESGGDDRVRGAYSGVMTVARNRFVNNWSGVIGWENANRFAGSGANSSTGATTLVNPSVATLEACSDPATVGTAPYYDDCRWKTQGLRVRSNVFVHEDRAVDAALRRLAAHGRIPDDTTCVIPGERNVSCGYVGVFSNYGTFEPFIGTVVEQAITFDQDNLWSDNRYVGDWSFMAMELGRQVTWREWRSMFGQDGGSTRVR